MLGENKYFYIYIYIGLGLKLPVPPLVYSRIRDLLLLLLVLLVLLLMPRAMAFCIIQFDLCVSESVESFKCSHDSEKRAAG